ncbi:hypothetical protein ACSMXN_01945 [Jatrophihabitans sp. DSM 45814]
MWAATPRALASPSGTRTALGILVGVSYLDFSSYEQLSGSLRGFPLAEFATFAAAEIAAFACVCVPLQVLGRRALGRAA